MLKKFNYSFSNFQSDCHLLPEDVLILPGVGCFSEGMAYLKQESLVEEIKNHANSGGKIIAICLGLQLLFHSSSESPGVAGLNILEGTVEKIPSDQNFSVPHIGWNSLVRTDSTPDALGCLFCDSGVSISDYYFVHSFYALPASKQDSIAAILHPSGLIDVAFKKSNVYAFQFHPKKVVRLGISF